MKTSIPAWILFSILGMVVAIHAQIGVSPPKFELPIGKVPTTESLRVFNYGDRKVEVSVTVHNWDLDEKNEVRILPPTEQSLDQWMVINPLRFSIEPSRSQTIRFSIRPRVEPQPGEHRAIIYLEEQRPPDENKTAFQVLFRLGIAVYGHVGEVTRTGMLHHVAIEDGLVWFDISSQGTANARFDGQYAVWSRDLYPGYSMTEMIADEGNPDAVPPGMLEVGSLPTTPILPGTRRRISMGLPEDLPDGSYMLDLNTALGTAVIDTGIPFSIAVSEEDRSDLREEKPE